MANGKAGKLCRVSGHCTRQRFFLKKRKKSLPSAKLGRHSAKSFLKKIKNGFAECVPPCHSGKSFFKKIIKNVFAECLATAALGKEFLKKKMSLPSTLTVGTRQRHRQRSSAVDGCFSLPSAAVGTRKRLCRVPNKWPSAKSLFAVKFFFRGLFAEGGTRQSLCRGLLGLCECPGPSAKKVPPVVNQGSDLTAKII